MRHNILVIFVLLFICSLEEVYAQSDSENNAMRVVEFSVNDQSYAAQKDNVRDGNDKLCALLKIEIQKYKNFHFAGSFVMPNNTKEIIGGYKVYLAPGAKRIIIKHNDFGELSYSFPEPLRSGITYSMKIKLPEATNNGVVYKLTTNVVGATVLFDSQNTYTTDENAQCKIVTQSGEHTIKVYTANSEFIGQEKVFKLLDGELLVEDTIYLKSTKHYNLELISDNGAQFILDGQLQQGKTRISVEVEGGMHTVQAFLGSEMQWRSEQKRILLNKDMNTSLFVKGSLRVTYPINAECVIEPIGDALPPSKNKINTNETSMLLGKYNLKIHKDGYEDKSVVVDIVPMQHIENFRVEGMRSIGDIYYDRGDFVKAYSEYAKLSKDFSDDQALYSLGVCFSSGKGCEKNETVAEMCWNIAARLGNINALKQLVSLTTSETKRFDLFLSAAQTGDAKSEYELAERYLYGLGVDTNYKSAGYWYSLSAEQMYPQAYRGLGDLYMYGLGVPKNVTEAQKYYELSSFYGDELSNERLADLDFLNGEKEKAIRTYMSLSHPTTNAQIRIAKYYIENKDYLSAANIYTKLDTADIRNSVWKDIELVANKIYEQKTNLSMAINLYEILFQTMHSANEFSNPIVYFRLGKYYYDNSEDSTKSLLYLEYGSNKQVGEASCLLGKIYYNGRLVKKDTQMALQYFYKAIQQGYDLANYDIGNYYRVELKDFETATKYYQLAACAGSKAAQKVLNQLDRTYKCDNL